MNIENLLDLLDEWIEKYNITDEDVAALQDILSDVSDEDMYGDEYQEDIPEEAE